MEAKDWNVPRKKEIKVSEIDPFFVESVAPCSNWKLFLSNGKNNAVLALGLRECMIVSRRLSQKIIGRPAWYDKVC